MISVSISNGVPMILRVARWPRSGFEGCGMDLEAIHAAIYVI